MAREPKNKALAPLRPEGELDLIMLTLFGTSHAANAMPGVRAALASLLHDRDQARRIATELRDNLNEANSDIVYRKHLPWEVPSVGEGQ